MNVLQQIFTDYYEEIEYTLHPRKTEMENIDKMIHCGDPSFGGAMYGCPHCGNLKFVPFPVIAVSALPAATNMPWNALPVCPLNWLMSHIAIVFSQSIKVFVNSFSRIVLYSIVCFTLQTALSPVCFTK